MHSFVEAEFHAVMKRRGALHDITPRNDGEKIVLFVPDPTRVAVRVDEHTWKTWGNHKSADGHIVEAAAPIEILDLVSDVHA